MFGLHHVICQTLVRVCGSPHAETNAAILPRAMAFMVARAPERLADLAAAIGTDPEDIEARILELGGNPPGLGALGADRAKLDAGARRDARPPRAAPSPRTRPTATSSQQLIESAW